MLENSILIRASCGTCAALLWQVGASHPHMQLLSLILWHISFEFHAGKFPFAPELVPQLTHVRMPQIAAPACSDMCPGPGQGTQNSLPTP